MFHKLVAPNLLGRDFLLGDLHGSLHLLRKKLTEVMFNPAVDRLFAVGDLVDRGRSSFECLALLKEPWFFYVLGNHEAMMLTYFGMRPSNFHRAKDFIDNGGDWVFRLSAEQLQQLKNEYLPLLLVAPLVITVNDPVLPFHVVHAEFAGSKDVVLHDQELTESTLTLFYNRVLWGRKLIGQAEEKLSGSAVDGVALTTTPIEPGLSITYVGHSILNFPVMHRSHVFIDRGAYTEEKGSELLLMEHRRFASFLIEAELVT